MTGRYSLIARMTAGSLMTLILLLLMVPFGANAQNHISEQAWYEDKTAHMSFKDVQQQRFEPFEGFLTKGYGDSVIWIRLRIDPSIANNGATTMAPSSLVLRVRPPYLDEIELFDPTFSPYKTVITGDRFQRKPHEYHSLNFNFSIPRGDKPRDIWLRLKTSSTRLIDVEALTFETMHEKDRLQELFYGLCIALEIVFLVWAMLHWLHSKDWVIGLFVIRQVLVTLWIFLVLGYARVFLSSSVPDGFLDILNSVNILLVTSLSLYFDCTLIREYRPPQWGLRMAKGLLLLLPIELGLIWAGKTSLALSINATLLLVGVTMIFLLALMSKPQYNARSTVLPKWMLVSLYGIIWISLGFSAAVLLGFLKGNEFALHAALAHSMLTGVVVMIFLQIRAHRLAKIQLQTLADLAIFEKRLENERMHREDQEKLLTMLGHELKTPLATMRMLTTNDTPGSGEFQRAINDMAEVIDRCVQTGQLSDQRLRPRAEPCNLVDMIWKSIDYHHLSSRIAFHSETNNALVTSDSQMLNIMFNNLMDNAQKYGDVQNEIEITILGKTRGTQIGYEITVSNLPGDAGFPDPEHVFDKYYRSPQAHRQIGSGLGLFLVSGLARVLGGDIRYEPDASHIRFVLWLPINHFKSD